MAHRSDDDRPMDKAGGALADATFDAIFIHDGERIIDANKSASSNTGYSHQELLDIDPLELVASEDRQRFIENVRSGRTEPYTVKGVRKDGTTIDAEVVGTTIPYKGGEAWVAAVRDISERRRAQEALKERMKELHCLYSLSQLVEVERTSLTELLADVVKIIPRAWQYPEITCVRISIEGDEASTDNFKETEWSQSADIMTHGRKSGTIEVRYLEERPEIDEGPFLREERSLMDAIAERLGRIIERRRAEERVEHLNRVLRAIRNVNQLITQEKDRDRLLQGVCDALMGTLGYDDAWITLVDDAGAVTGTFQASPREGYTPVSARLEEGYLPGCARTAMDRPGVVVTEPPSEACGDCPIEEQHRMRGVLTSRLEHGGRVHGLLSVAIPREFVMEDDEQALFDEVSSDIAFGLWSVEVEGERKLGEEAIRTSEEKYRSLIMNLPDVVWRISAKGEILFVCPHVVDVLGITDAEFYEAGNALWESLVHPEDSGRVISAFDRLFERGEGYDLEYRIRRKDGSWIWVNDRAFEHHEVDGVTVCDGMLTDITERKEAEEALRYRGEFKNLILEMSSRFISLKPTEIDAHIAQAIEDVSTFAKADAGFVFRFSEDLERVTLSHLWHSERVDLEAVVIRGTQETGWDWSLGRLRGDEAIRVRTLDDLPEPAAFERGIFAAIGINSFIAVPMSFEGTMDGFLGLASAAMGRVWSDDDVDMVRLIGTIFSSALHRKMADQEFSNIFDLSSDLIGVIDLETGRWQRTNPAFEEVLGYGTEETLSMGFIDMIHPKDHGRALSFLRREKGSGGSFLKTRVITKGKGNIWVGWTMNTSPEGDQVYAVGTDITEREVAREELLTRLMEHRFEDGNIYLVKESKPDRSHRAFKDLLRVGYDCVVFSRMTDNVLSEMDPRDLTKYMLSTRDVKSSVRPRVDLIEALIHELPPRAAILIDRLDFIIFNNGFDATLSFIHTLHDIAYLNNHIVILSLDPDTMKGNTLPLLEKECLELEPIHKTLLSHELMTVLKVVHKRAQRNLRTSYTDLMSEIGISKPTTRRRIGDLIYYGYLMEVLSGRRKTFVLSEKGRSIFTE